MSARSALSTHPVHFKYSRAGKTHSPVFLRRLLLYSERVWIASKVCPANGFFLIVWTSMLTPTGSSSVCACQIMELDQQSLLSKQLILGPKSCVCDTEDKCYRIVTRHVSGVWIQLTLSMHCQDKWFTPSKDLMLKSMGFSQDTYYKISRYLL